MDIDVRGPRFGAAVTALVLAAVLVTGSDLLLVWQTLCFAAGAALGVQRTPYGLLYRTAVRPRIAPPTDVESPAAPRFAQAVGLAFAALGLIGQLWGPGWLGLAAVGCALGAAFLNATFGYCLGCELFLLLRRTMTVSR
ncbi:DUF4395 domain-containing protein [Streptomyces sp. NPDC002889]|uniref:DUF4395 domain-containing protein n=1 Tax=Streptomyces sp. NPDC002889 TaxID=3364669 RepID=UPI0036894CD6